MLQYFYLAIGTLSLLGVLFAQDAPIKIRSVTIIGNESVSNKELTHLLRQKPSSWLIRGAKLEPRLVKLDALTLKNYFHSRGFLNAVIKESYKVENNVADIYYNIMEGKQFFVSQVDIRGNELISNDELKTIFGITVNEPYNPVRINENIALVESHFHEYGKLFVKLKIQDDISDSVAISILINEGPDVIIHHTFIEEEDPIDSIQIYRELKYEKGDHYSLSAMDLTKRRLRETGIFSMVNLIPVKVADSDSLVNIVINLSQFKQREWNSVGGYEKIEFYEGTELPAIGGFIEWRNRSIFNSTTNFSTKLMIGIPWETKFNKPRFRYDISLFNNWLLLIRWPTRVTGFYETLVNYQEENKSFPRIERYGVEISQQVKLDERSFFENNEVWEYFSDQEDSIRNLQQRSISMRLHLDRKNDPLFPRKGYSFDTYFKSTGYFLGGEREYLKADISLQTYIPVGNESVFAFRLKSGRIWDWNSDFIDYSYEKFYLGGSTSMRGWDVLSFEKLGDKPWGEIIRFMVNIEYRFPVYKSIGITLFSDGGILSNTIDSISMNAVKWDGGIGLTINTPIGPARLDYAVQFDSPETGKFHLGVRYLF